LEITLAFLLVALAAYTLFGGADFGGGILEATLWRHPDLQKKIQDTLAPVWEANHVWLIAIIVILFVGFPVVYAELCTMLFVPISIALLGIILRGAFFTFRKYDPEPETRQAFYSLLFRVSSALTPMMYGMIIASLLGDFPSRSESATPTFGALYIEPWATVHGLLCTVFVFALFGYVAAVFLYGEVDSDKHRKLVARRIGLFFIMAFIVGGLVLAYGAAADIVSLSDELNPIQLAVQTVAFLCIPLLWLSMKRQQAWRMRLIAGVQVLCILGGWFTTQYPVFMKFDDGRRLTIYNSSAPDVTLIWLNIGLVCVLAMVLPLLVYLYRVFSRSRANITS